LHSRRLKINNNEKEERAEQWLSIISSSLLLNSDITLLMGNGSAEGKMLHQKRKIFSG